MPKRELVVITGLRGRNVTRFVSEGAETCHAFGRAFERSNKVTRTGQAVFHERTNHPIRSEGEQA